MPRDSHFCWLAELLLVRATSPGDVYNPAVPGLKEWLVFRPLVLASVLSIIVAAGLRSIMLASGTPQGSGTATAPAASVPAITRFVPAPLEATSWLEPFRKIQTESARRLAVPHDFKFTDRLAETGITFQHHIVDDAGKTYKAVHYDHGNGLAIADVDGDGLTDLYFVNQVGGSQLWKNQGERRFTDITDAAGVRVPDKIGVSASFADIDNDGDADLYVTTVRGGNQLFENNGKGQFRDITAAAGVGYVGHSSAAVFFDYDRDGLLDLFLVNVGRYTSDAVGGVGYRFFVGLEDAFSGHLFPDRAERSVLYHNDGRNHFTDVSQAMGLMDTSWSGDATPIDVNDDGWLDLYVLNMQGNDEYYENEGGKRFVQKSRQVFPRTSWGAMGVKVFDFNNDGRLDLFVTDMHSDMSQEVAPDMEGMKSQVTWPESFRGDGRSSIWGNSLYFNRGPNQYQEVSDALNAESYWPWGPSIADLNADGWDDAFVTAGMGYPFRYSINSVKLNDRGVGFVDAEFTLGVEPRAGGVSLPWFDLDASGADKAHRDAAGATGRVSIRGAKSSRSAAIFDIDGDGDLDIVTSEFNAAPMVLVSDLAQRGTVHRLEVALVGRASNRAGIGAVVKVTAPGVSATKVMDGKTGYLSQSVAPLYFGLGTAAAVTRVEVLWPSGARQVVERPAIDGRLEIREP